MKNLIKTFAFITALIACYSVQAQNESSGKETKPNSSTPNKTSPVNKNTSAKKDNAGTSANSNTNTGNSSATNSNAGSNTNTTTGAGHANTGNGEDYKYGDSKAAGKEYREPMVGNNKTGRKEKAKVSTDTSAGPRKSASVKKNSPMNK